MRSDQFTAATIMFHAYIAKKKDCGCIVAAAVDEPKWKNVVDEDIARWVRDGYSVERVEASLENPIALKRCEHSKAVSE